MKKTVLFILTAALILGMSACGGAFVENESDSTPGKAASSPALTETAAEPTAQEAPSAPEQSAARAETQPVQAASPAEYEYTIEALSCTNAGKTIYGQLYLPKGAGTPLPAVICSHSFSLTHASMNSYCTQIARSGYAAYCFDFCGGSNKSLSDGKTTDMTVFTEVSDLEAVLNRIRSLPHIDTENLFLLGSSQGGLVSALAAANHPAEIRGMILLYPGLSMPEQFRSYFPDPENITDRQLMMFSMSGTSVGRAYIQTLYNYDVYGHIKNYSRDVLILHGTMDFTVPIRYSEKAVEVYPSATLRTIEGAMHGFNRENMSIKDYDSQVQPLILDFIKTHIV